MENYTLIVLVALFLGVMGIIAMLEQRRRTELTHSTQLLQTLSDCLASLQAIHTRSEAQMSQVAEALNQVLTAVETGAKCSSESAVAICKETTHTVEKATARLESSLLQHQKALSDAARSSTKELSDRLEWLAGKLSGTAESNSKEVLSEVQRITKAVQDLKASLEESVNFNPKI